MKRAIILVLSFVAVSVLASEWKIVVVRGAEAIELMTVADSTSYIPDPTKNEYPMSYSFPATNMMYWKKSGNDWVEMNAGEKTAKNTSLKEQATTNAVADVDTDALFQVIADAVKNNLKTKQEVVDAFKAAVDPKKADKKEKEKK